jgi:AcrR family transcriptional regulator
MSTTSSSEEKRRRGRPRSERARTAVLESAIELLLKQGLATVTMDEVAARAGVSKATIYRWWRSKELLALDALHYQWETQPDEDRDTGSLRGDLLSLLRPWIHRAMRRPLGHVVAALVIEAHMNPEFAEAYQELFVQPRRAPGHAALERAIGRGEIPRGTDTDAVLDLLYGALYHRLLHEHLPLNDRFVERSST